MRVRPEAFLKAEDIAICLMSAGHQNFSRENQAFRSIEDIDRLFKYPDNWGFPGSEEVKSRDCLKTDFKREKVSHPEVSCTYLEQKIPMEFVDMLIIDPYIINGVPLFSYVANMLEKVGFKNFAINKRFVVLHRRPLYGEIADFLMDGAMPAIGEVLQNSESSPALKQWAQDIQKNDLTMQWKNFVFYLTRGTLQYIQDDGEEII